MRRVTLLGAFEIAPELDPSVRDGLILGSRRDAKGFVIETSRENIDLIVSASSPSPEGLPVRMALAIGPLLTRMGATLLRVELRPTPGAERDPNGAFVQGSLVLRQADQRIIKLPMTATEALQVAIAHHLSIMATSDLLQLDVSQFLDEVDSYSQKVESEIEEFKSFVDNVTASDFAQYLRNRPGDSEAGPESP